MIARMRRACHRRACHRPPRRVGGCRVALDGRGSARAAHHTWAVSSLPAEAAFPDWPQYASRISAAVRGLSDEQLALRASPGHLPLWILAAHIASARLYWLCLVCGEPGLENSEVLDATGDGWDDHEDRPRSGDELAGALDGSWAVLADCLTRWTPDLLTGEVARERRGRTERHTRISILNRLLSHDAYHAGEMSQLLGAAGLPAIDLWGAEPG